MAEPEMRNKFLIVMSTGAAEPKKAFTPFYYAAAAASMGFDTSMFFLAEAPSLLKPGVAETIRTIAEGEPLTKVIDLGRKNGVKFLCCSVSAKVIWKIEEQGLPEGMEFAGAATLLEMAANPEVAVLYF
jgi:predicted peroxiredoxin